MHVDSPQGFLQYLMMAFLPDQTARKNLILPTQVDVDFRAACFCHKKVVDVGFVCSICLSSTFPSLSYVSSLFALSRFLDYLLFRSMVSMHRPPSFFLF